MPPAREATHSTASLAALSHWSSVTRILRTIAPSSTNTNHCPNVSPRTDTLVLVFDSSHSIFPRVSSRRLLRQSPSSLLPAWTMRAILPESGQLHNLQVGNSTASLMKSPRRIGTRNQPADDPVTTLTARHHRRVPRWSGPHAPTRRRHGRHGRPSPVPRGERVKCTDIGKIAGTGHKITSCRSRGAP